jgi:hypothetical protein
MSYGDLFPGGLPDRPRFPVTVMPWCKKCQAGTPSKTCERCDRPKAACDVCGRCPRCDGPYPPPDHEEE